MPHVLAEEIFRVFDFSRTGQLTFKDWVCGLVLFSEKSTEQERLQFVFSIFDVNDKGSVSKQNMNHILRSLQAAGSSSEGGSPGMLNWFDLSGKDELVFEDFQLYAAREKRCNVLITWVYEGMPNLARTTGGNANVHEHEEILNTNFDSNEISDLQKKYAELCKRSLSKQARQLCLSGDGNCNFVFPSWISRYFKAWCAPFLRSDWSSLSLTRLMRVERD